MRYDLIDKNIQRLIYESAITCNGLVKELKLFQIGKGILFDTSSLFLYNFDLLSAIIITRNNGDLYKLITS